MYTHIHIYNIHPVYIYTHPLLYSNIPIKLFHPIVFIWTGGHHWIRLWSQQMLLQLSCKKLPTATSAGWCYGAMVCHGFFVNRTVFFLVLHFPLANKIQHILCLVVGFKSDTRKGRCFSPTWCLKGEILRVFHPLDTWHPWCWYGLVYLWFRRLLLVPFLVFMHEAHKLWTQGGFYVNKQPFR